MISLSNLLPKKAFKLTPNTWTHLTSSEELMKDLKKGKKFIGKKEDLSKFNIQDKGSFRTSTNQEAPNFKKGGIFSGYEASPYLITTELGDEAFQPNWNARNYDNLGDSNNVGVLKPTYRDAKHFKLWKRDKKGQYVAY